MRWLLVLWISGCLFLSSIRQFAVSQERKVSLLFAGDAMQHLPQVHSAKTENGYNYDSCFYLIKDNIASADIACVNFETVLGGKPYTGYPTFSSPDEFASALKNAGFDVFFLANNHAMDGGQKGLERTIDVLDSLQIKHTGTFKSPHERTLRYPLMLIKNGIRIALLNYTYKTNGIPVKNPSIVNFTDTFLIKKDIGTARRYKPDIIIANMHWGEEYLTYPTTEQRKMAQFLINNGVRMIIGHHPHVVEPVSVYRKEKEPANVVYYSLGNFISNQQHPHTEGGMIAEIVIRKTSDEAPAEIESHAYSFIWVRKYRDKEKTNYVLIPTTLSRVAITPPFSKEEKETMEKFTEHAEKTVQKTVP